MDPPRISVCCMEHGDLHVLQLLPITFVRAVGMHVDSDGGCRWVAERRKLAKKRGQEITVAFSIFEPFRESYVECTDDSLGGGARNKGVAPLLVRSHLRTHICFHLGTSVASNFNAKCNIDQRSSLILTEKTTLPKLLNALKTPLQVVLCHQL